MKRFIKYFAVLLTAFFILSLLSCQTIKLNNIEKQYSQEFRLELESIEDKEELTEILNNGNKVEVLHNRFLKLEDIEEKYSHSFREAIECISDNEYHITSIISIKNIAGIKIITPAYVFS